MPPTWPRPKPDLAKDKAELENARREADRYALAAQKGYVSVEQSDQAATRVVTFSATVKADQAAVDNARLELEYCSIRAPFAGRTGEIQSDQGNLIKANADGPMVTLNQTQPVLVAFTVPGQHLQDIFRYMAAGALQVTANNTLSDTGAAHRQTCFHRQHRGPDHRRDPAQGQLYPTAKSASGPDN